MKRIIAILITALFTLHLLATPVRADDCDNPAGCVIGPGISTVKIYLPIVTRQKGIAP